MLKHIMIVFFIIFTIAVAYIYLIEPYLEVQEATEIFHDRIDELDCKELRDYIFKFVLGKDVDQYPKDRWIQEC